MDSKDKKAKDEELKERLRKAGSAPGAEEKVRKSFFTYFKKNKDNLTFGAKVEKIYDLLSSKKLRTQDKAVIIGALLYFINPFDFIPDLTPFIGFVDDMSIIALVYRYLGNRADEEGSTLAEPDSDDDSDTSEN